MILDEAQRVKNWKTVAARALTRINSPYAIVTEPPEDYPKLRRHRNKKYKFERVDGYVPPPL